MPTFACLHLGSERVKSKWCRVHCVGNTNRLLYAIDGKNWHERAKRFINDHRIINVIDLNDSNVNKIFSLVHLSSNQNLSLRIINHLLNSLEMSLVDNSGEV